MRKMESQRAQKFLHGMKIMFGKKAEEPAEGDEPN